MLPVYDKRNNVKCLEVISIKTLPWLFRTLGINFEVEIVTVIYYPYKVIWKLTQSYKAVATPTVNTKVNISCLSYSPEIQQTHTKWSTYIKTFTLLNTVTTWQSKSAKKVVLAHSFVLAIVEHDLTDISLKPLPWNKMANNGSFVHGWFIVYIFQCH